MQRSDQVALLRESYLFAALSIEDLHALAENSTPHFFAAGQLAFKQGNPANCVHVIASGVGEERIRVGNDEVPISSVSFADVVGEDSLLAEHAGLSTSSLMVLEEMATLAIPFAKLASMGLAGELTSALKHEGSLVGRVLMIKRATLFATLPAAVARQLAASITLRTVCAGELLVQEGEPGKECYLVLSGSFVAYQGKSSGQHLTQVGPGEFVGEVSLLAGEPRFATVVATQVSEVLILHRHHLQQAMEASGHTSAALKSQIIATMRPRRAESVLLYRRAAPDGESLLILKHTRQLRYFQLSELGAFVWEHLDGKNSLKSIIARVLTQRGVFAAQPIVEIAQALLGSEFACLADGSRYSLPQMSRAAGIQGFLSFRVALVSPIIADAWASRLFKWFGILTRRSTVALLGSLGVAGLIVAFATLFSSSTATDLGLSEIVIGVIAFIASILVHEVGHILAMKAYGLSVSGFGVGWSCFYPVAFVDTSDTWIAPNSQRTTVALAGPLANLVLGGIFALLATIADAQDSVTALWVVATVNFAITLLAMAPNGASDGAQVVRTLLKWPGKGWKPRFFLDKKQRRSTPSKLHMGKALVLTIVSVVHAVATTCLLYFVLVAIALKSLIQMFGDSATLAAAIIAGVLAVLLSLGVSNERQG